MTRHSDGKLDERTFSVIRDAETGRQVKLLCWHCEGEYEDRDVFIAHDCRDVRDVPKARSPVTDKALALADEEGVDLTYIEGTGKEGRIVKADVVAAIEEE